MLSFARPCGRLRNAHSAAVPGPESASVLVADEQRLRAHQRLTGPLDERRQILRVHSPSPIEEARAYRRALDERNLTKAELARELGMDRRRVSEKLSLLWLPPSVQALFISHPSLPMCVRHRPPSKLL